MIDYKYHRLRAQLSVLKDVENEYPTCSISNIIRQIQSRIDNYEKQNDIK